MSLPEHKYIGTEKYRLVVFVIREFTALGIPKTLEMVRPSQIVKLSEEEPELNQFMTGYVPERMLETDPTRGKPFNE